MRKEQGPYDVAILGAGLGGTTLGAILARQGLKTVIIDKGSHPKFSIGESTVSETNLQFEIMAARYDVPELDYFRSFDRSKAILRTNGIKNNFGFVYHREGKYPVLEEINQFTVTSALHMFRQDVDQYLLQVAVKYGCEVREHTSVDDVMINDDDVELKSKHGTLRARYVVDGTGHASLLARKFGLRDEVPRMHTHSRSNFTHMIMAGSFDKYVNTLGPASKLPTAPMDQGTLHHVFKGGWIWVIPMNNNDHSINPVCSVGLTLDPRMYPDEGLSAEQEWERALQRFPAVRDQFAKAKPIRAWVKAPRIQYTSSKLIGHRFCLLPHASGFVDPLFSRGMVITTKGVNLVAGTVLEAFRANDFRPERFMSIERNTQRWLKTADQLVHGAFRSFDHYEMWNAWTRVWHTYGATRFFGAANRFMDFLETGNRELLWRGGTDPVLGYEDPRPQEVLDACHNVVLRYERGELRADQAVAGVYRELEGTKDYFFPIYDVQDRTQRLQKQPTPAELFRWFRWVHYAPKEFRQTYYSRNFFKQMACLFRILGVKPPSRFWYWLMPPEPSHGVEEVLAPRPRAQLRAAVAP